ncbi:hypothetical protein [uncultured Psychrobacter sp.]|uniref:hypothetical protein n=1 Tax=Psychrobacter sp. VH5 TaxID=3423439 RepID=UPI002596626B|nr:hypothetical protein [uncultured Psychrobacter sp.]
MKKNISITVLFSSVIISGCNINLTNSNVCREDIRPFFTIEDSHNPSINDKASLTKIDKNGVTVLRYEFQNIKRYDNEKNAHVYFLYDRELIVPNYTYKLSYNDTTYFIHDIKMANNTHYRYCDEQTTYKINQCESSGYNISVDPSCAIPADQADSYFENKVKPTM